MDINSITQLISGVGFPIAACIYMAWNNEKLQKTLSDLTSTLTLMNERLKDVETAINFEKKEEN